jgi:hypothetical protein
MMVEMVLVVVEFMRHGATIILKFIAGRSKKRLGMLTYDVMLIHDTVRPHTTNCSGWSTAGAFQTGSFLTILFTALISLRATTARLPI